LFRHDAPAIPGHRLIGDQAIDAAERILGDLLATLARQYFPDERKIFEADGLLVRRQARIEDQCAGAVECIEMAAGPEIDFCEPGEEAVELHLQDQDADSLAGLAPDRDGDGNDVDLRRRGALVDGGDIRLPAGGHALVPIAIGEILAMHRRHLRDVGHQAAARIAEENAVDGGEVLWHAGHDLHRFRPIALRHQIAKAQARRQRDADVDHAVELFGEGDGGKIGQRAAARDGRCGQLPVDGTIALHRHHDS
jgi:hypothetical protein